MQNSQAAIIRAGAAPAMPVANRIAAPMLMATSKGWRRANSATNSSRGEATRPSPGAAAPASRPLAKVRASRTYATLSARAELSA